MIVNPCHVTGEMHMRGITTIHQQLILFVKHLFKQNFEIKEEDLNNHRPKCGMHYAVIWNQQTSKQTRSPKE
jgi:hypothetical protein